MRTARLTLLLAAALLVAAEVVSLSLLVKALGNQQEDRVRQAAENATAMVPQIADWVRAQGKSPAGVSINPRIEPFDQLMLEESQTPGLDEPTRQRLEKGELIVVSQISERTLSVLGSVQTTEGLRVFRLVDSTRDTTRLATDQLLIAQHGFILLAALIGFSLAALVPKPSAERPVPAARAYEEAMSRLRLRDDERLAAFEREKNALTSTLRDREAMARAGELTAGIVHEVRNSIGAIAMHAKFGEQASDERIRKAALAVADEVRAIQTVMTRFVDFIRTQEVHLAEFDLGRLVERVASREQSNHQAQVDVEGVATRVSGDEDLLERAIENIVRNACQASTPPARVAVKFGADATHAFVIVDDDGPGITDPNRSLRPFESERPGGLGLGLPLALKILSLHQGTLDLTRRPAGGTQAVCRWLRTAPPATSRNETAAQIDDPSTPSAT